MFPDVVSDPIQLQEWTEEILTTGVGQLFTFQENPNKLPKTVDAPRARAWDDAYATVQKVEALIRGYAWKIEGTQWNRWYRKKETPPKQDDDDTSLIPKLQEELIVRLWEEGLAYMTVRSMKLQQLVVEDTPMEEPTALLEGREIQDESDVSKRLLGGVKGGEIAEHQEKIEPKEEPFLNDFALPGPTTFMYDTVLDSIACQKSYKDPLDTMQTAEHLQHRIMQRHILDGGDEKNCNEHTRPSQMSFNTLIRIGSRMPNRNEQVRDTAITLAFESFQSMQDCKVTELNSATHTYLLDTVSAFMPTSRVKGNIACGIYGQAHDDRLVNGSLVKAFARTNEPSNSKGDDKAVADAHEVSPKYKANSRKRRHHLREDTY